MDIQPTNYIYLLLFIIYLLMELMEQNKKIAYLEKMIIQLAND